MSTGKYTIIKTNVFHKDIKKSVKRGKSIDKILYVVEIIEAKQSLPPKNKPHKLSGDWANCWECHIEPDWLLIWRYDGNNLILERTGTHSDLFK